MSTVGAEDGVTQAEVPTHAPDEILKEDRWELVEHILNSPELKRSARLRELLHYLGQQAIFSGATSIREQEIGEAVFGRSTDYDTSLDNIVRVNVTELRKRIHLYFKGEGAAEKYLIEIPRGTYVPVFSVRTPIAGDVSSPDAPPLLSLPPENWTQQIPVLSFPFRTAFYSAAASAALLAVIVVFLWVQNSRLHSQLYPWQEQPAMRSFWSTFLESDGDVDLVTADTSLALSEDILNKQVTLDDYLDYKYADTSLLPGVSQETKDTLHRILSRNMGSVGDFRVASDIMTLSGRAHKLRLANARAFTPEDVKTNNVILIGGIVSNPWTALYHDRMDFYEENSMTTHHATYINHNPQGSEQKQWEPQSNPNLGYSMVAFLPNMTPRRYALVIAGSDSQSTQAAGEWLISGEGLAWIRQKSPDGVFPFFEVLLSTSHLVGTPLRTEVLAYRIHPR